MRGNPIRLLRPAKWLAEVSASEGAVIEVSLDELHIHGPALVRSVTQPRFDTSESGCPVTGTTTHIGTDVMAVKVVGSDNPLEVTASHRLFSESRNDWVPASELVAGEVMRTERGSVVVEALDTTARGPVTVYNLEVALGHRYYVGDARVLAHNACGRPSFVPKGPDGKPLPLPRGPNGELAPSSMDPHTQIGWREGRQGGYVQTREFGPNGQPVKQVDWTDHGRPGLHTAPHVHDYVPNPTGGSPQHGAARPPSPGEL